MTERDINKPFLERKSISKKALEARIDRNRNAERDFDEWSINLLPKLPLKATILDLGCGTGKQLNLFSQFFGADSKIIALDKSRESLYALSQSYNDSPKLQLINADFEDSLSCLNINDSFFDLVYSFYALYYAENFQEIIRKIYKYLKKGGVFWVVSPYKGTNIEIFEIIARFYELDYKVVYSIEKFYKNVISLVEKVGFKRIKIDIFKNKIIYENKEQLMSYLHNTTFYRKKYDKEISSEVNSIFISSKDFRLTKNAVSVKLEK